jgi:hypothetical protein
MMYKKTSRSDVLYYAVKISCCAIVLSMRGSRRAGSVWAVELISNHWSQERLRWTKTVVMVISRHGAAYNEFIERGVSRKGYTRLYWVTGAWFNRLNDLWDNGSRDNICISVLQSTRLLDKLLNSNGRFIWWLVESPVCVFSQHIRRDRQSKD